MRSLALYGYAILSCSVMGCCNDFITRLEHMHFRAGCDSAMWQCWAVSVAHDSLAEYVAMCLDGGPCYYCTTCMVSLAVAGYV